MIKEIDDKYSMNYNLSKRKLRSNNFVKHMNNG